MNVDRNTSATVAILNVRERVQGAGVVLTTSGLIATCVHVLTQSGVTPDGEVELEFRLAGQPALRRIARAPRKWWATAQDLAILQLASSLPEQVLPCTLGSSRDREQRAIRAIGYPGDSKQAALADGRLVGVLPDGSLQIASTQLTHRFSGGPIFDAKDGTVIGIAQIVEYPDAAGRLSDTAYAIPIECLQQLVPELKITPFFGDIWLSVSTAIQTLQPGLLQQVGHDKYVPELYIARDVDEQVHEFVEFGERFVEQAQVFLRELELIAPRYQLGVRAHEALATLRRRIEQWAVDTEVAAALASVKQYFYYKELEAGMKFLDEALLAANPAAFSKAMQGALETLASLPISLPDGRGDAGQRRELVEMTLSANLQHLLVLSRMQGAQMPRLADQDFVQELFPAQEKTPQQTPRLANELLRDLDRLWKQAIAPCLAIVGPAGSGKTNSLCHVASTLSARHPTLLVTGQIEQLSNDGIERYLYGRLQTAQSEIPTDWLRKIDRALRINGRWLVVILDGINEASTRSLMQNALSSFLGHIKERRVKLIVSCRDIVWEHFAAELRPHLFGGKPILQTNFSTAEQEQALSQYFAHYDIKGSIGEISPALRSPLWLRLFCKANERKAVRDANAIERYTVSELYIQHLGHQICKRRNLAEARDALAPLFEFAAVLWDHQSVSLPLSKSGFSQTDAADQNSIYNILRAEGVLFVESSDQLAGPVAVRFVYDEFMEYVLARTWAAEFRGKKPSLPKVEPLLKKIVPRLFFFSAALGALLFFDQLLQMGGLLINRVIPWLMVANSDSVPQNQSALLLLFRHVNVDGADDELIACLKRFESVAQGDIKSELSKVVLEFLKRSPDHPDIQELAKRILEISSSEHAERTGNAKDAESEVVHALPPARYHYAEETRLQAIAVLASGRSEQSHQLVEVGIRQLGALEMHSALEGLRALDFTSDEFVLKMIPRHLAATAPEYRIYCCWLLRSRYGKDPARYLVRLLEDADPRVHEYAYDLCLLRGVEHHLQTALLDRLSAREPKSWHLLHMLRLLAKRNLLVEQIGSQQQVQRVANMLARFASHPYQAVRVEVCAGLLAYRDHADVAESLAQFQEAGERVILNLIARSQSRSA